MLEMLGEAALRTTLLAGVVQCTLWLLRIRQARLLLAAWTIVLAASVSMPLLPVVTPLTTPLDPALSRSLLDGAAGLMPQPVPQPAPAETVPELRSQPAIGAWLKAVYAAVACGLALRVLLGVGLSLRILARAVPLRSAWAAGLRVRTSRDVTGPVTIAWFVVFPIDVADWPVKTRHAALAHEQAHVVRLDFAMLIVSQLNRAIFWFSPLPWFLHRRLVALTERASDDQAIAATRDRLAYAEILLEMGRREVPVPRGLAMARRSTLPQRIERILLDQPMPPGDGWLHPALLTVGIAGLSLAVAGLTPGAASNPPMTMLAEQQAQPDEPTAAPVRHGAEARLTIEPTTAARQAPLQAQSSPPPAMATDPRPRRLPAPVQSAPLPAITAQPSRPAPPPPPRAAVRTAQKSVPALLPPREPQTPIQATILKGSKDEPGPQAIGATVAPPPMVAVELAAKTGSLAGDDARWSLPQLIAYRPLASLPPSESEGVVGTTCLGSLVAGPGVWGSATPNQPAVTAGQRIPVQAQFFRKQTGVPWVRFTAFERPPLDLPVRPARGGFTWTGEYGISYTVQESAENRLVGLAGRVANDSARLELVCARSTTRVF